MRNVDPGPRHEQSLTLTIPQAAGLLGISVSKAYEAARAGDLPTVKIGVRVLVSRRRIHKITQATITAINRRSEALATHRNNLEQKQVSRIRDT